MKTKVLSALVTFLFTATLLPLTVTAAEVAIWGSTTCKKRFLDPGKEALEKATGIELRVLGVGTGQGMVALFDGRAEVVASSNTLEQSILSAQRVREKMGMDPQPVPKGLQYHMITEDIMVPIVHRDNPVSELSWEQLTDVHTGRISNWQEIGGPDLPIQVVTSHAGSSTMAAFREIVMKGEPYTSAATVVSSTPLEVEAVSTSPGAIGIISRGVQRMDPELTKVISTEPIKRPLGLITIGDPSPEVREIISFFLSDEGRVYREWTIWRYPMGR